MSYQVLARKWRPKNFTELVGQEHVLKALVNALDSQRLHHAYLFSGTRGVGKTTIARILARALNCETGITSSPCGECSSCQEINEGRFVDLIEVDAASRTKVEDTRDLLENVQYLPSKGRFKIYLIDEVHMLSNHSFNALLKTLEEPPEHVKFLLATTDPQKLPVTILSRCLQFNLKNITRDFIQKHLDYVLVQEQIDFEEDALWHISSAANGSMRDALSLTDQAISHGAGKLEEEAIVSMLGTVDRQRVYKLMHSLVDKNAKELLKQTQALKEFSPNYQSLVQGLMAVVQGIAIYQQVPEVELLNDLSAEDVVAFSQKLSLETTQLYYQILLLGQQDMHLNPDMHAGFEMLMLRLLAFQPTESYDAGNKVKAKPESAVQATRQSTIDGGDFVKKLKGTTANDALVMHQNAISPETQVTEAEVPLAHNSHNVAPVSQSNTTPEPQQRIAPIVKKNAPSANSQQSNLGLNQSVEKVQHKQAHIQEKSSVGAEWESQAPILWAEFNEQQWVSLFKQLGLKGRLRNLVGHMQLDRVDKDSDKPSLHFLLAQQRAGLFEPVQQEQLQAVLSDYFTQPVQVQVHSVDNEHTSDKESPAQQAKRIHYETLAAAETRIMNSELVQGLIDNFQATLKPGSVRFNDT